MDLGFNSYVPDGSADAVLGYVGGYMQRPPARRSVPKPASSADVYRAPPRPPAAADPAPLHAETAPTLHPTPPSDARDSRLGMYSNSTADRGAPDASRDELEDTLRRLEAKVDAQDIAIAAMQREASRQVTPPSGEDLQQCVHLARRMAATVTTKTAEAASVEEYNAGTHSALPEGERVTLAFPQVKAANGDVLMTRVACCQDSGALTHSLMCVEKADGGRCIGAFAL